MNFLKKKELNEKHIGVLTKFAALRGEILSGRIPIKGKDSKGCKPDQFVNNYYRMHDLIRGIYAYKDAKFALSIMIKDTGMYGNEITYFSPENWRINYKPPTDARGKHDIKTLQNCFSKNIPLGVLRNLKHATNEVLWLGKIIDEKNGIFSIVPLILSLEDENNVEHYTDAYYDKKIQQEKFSQIIDVPHFVDSKQVGLIQLADFICFFLRKHIELSLGYVEPNYDEEIDKVNKWTDIILNQTIDNRYIYMSRGRCECSELFYKYAPTIFH